MSQLGWRLFQASVVCTFMYIDYAAPMDGKHNPGMALIVGVIAAGSLTVCLTALFDNVAKLFRAITHRRAPHIAETQSEDGSLPAIGGQVSKLLQDPTRRGVSQNPRDLL